MAVRMHPAAAQEYRLLPEREREAMLHAREKLEAVGGRLGFPHSSAVQGADRLRELRPRAGRSPWTGLYRRVGSDFVLAAIGPEATVDPRGFRQAVRAAEDRLVEVERETRTHEEENT